MRQNPKRLANNGPSKDAIKGEFDDLDNIATSDYKQDRKAVRLDLGLAMYPAQPKRRIEKLLHLGRVLRTEEYEFPDISSSRIGGLGSYTGEAERHVAHGMGKAWFSDGSMYCGQWRRGKFNGRGLFRERGGPMRGGSEYLGYWQDGVRQGKGKQTRPDWSCYMGDFVADKFDGFGEWHNEMGVFVGEFLRGKQSGWGRLVYPGGSVYEGMFHNGERHGLGRLTDKTHITEGEFINGFSVAAPRPIEVREEPTVSLEATISLEVTKDALALALENYNVEHVESLLYELFHNAISTEGVKVRLTQGPTSIMDFGSAYASERVRKLGRDAKLIRLRKPVGDVVH